MRTILPFIAFTIVFVSNALAQKYVFIKTGRPETMEYNNARNIVAKKWGIQFKYVAFNSENTDTLKVIAVENKTTEAKLVNKKGPNWNADFTAEVNAELIKINGLRTKIEQQILTLNHGSEKMIHFEQTQFKNRYKAFVFGQIEVGDLRPYYVLQVYKINIKKGTLKLVSEPLKPIDFEYKENGIEKA